MIIKITPNVSISYPIKYMQNGSENTYVLDGSDKALEMLKSGQDVKVVSWDKDRYQVLAEDEISAVSGSADGVEVRLKAKDHAREKA